jgi:hypothetical protein
MGACGLQWRLVSQVGIEPTTRGLKVPCSATELLALLNRKFIRSGSWTLSPKVVRGEAALVGITVPPASRAAGEVEGKG